MKRTWLIVAILGASVWVGSNQLPAAEAVVINLTQWTPPDISKVGEETCQGRVRAFHRYAKRDRARGFGRGEAFCR